MTLLGYPVSLPAPDVLATRARRLTETAARACFPWVGRNNKEAADLVRSNTVAMALTGVTDGPLLHGVQHDTARGTHVTETLVLASGTAPQRVTTHHDASAQTG